MVIRELVTKLGFETDASTIKKYEKSVASMKASMAQLAVVVSAAAGSIFAIAKTTANHGEEADKLSKRLGLTAERYQEFAFAAHLADVSQEEFTMGLTVLQRTLGQARIGSKEAAKGFGMLGSDVLKLVKSGASTDEVFMAVNRGLNRIPDASKRAAISQAIFGRSSAKLSSFLSKSNSELEEAFKKARDYGLVLDQETIAASNEFNDQLKEIIGQFTGLKNAVGSGLVKALAPLLRQFNEFISQNRELIKTNITNVIQSLTDIVSVAFSVMKKLANVVMALVSPMGGLGNAIKFVVSGFAAFKALQFLAGLGQMTQMVFTLAKGFRMAGLMAALMNAQALLIPILIGTGIALLVLAIEDIIGFFQGKDSVTDVVVESVKSIINYITDLIDSFNKFMLDSPIGWIFKGPQGLMDFVGGLMPSSVSADSALPGSNVSNQKTLNNSINAPMTFNMGAADSDPQRIGSSVYDNLDELLRTSSRNLSSGVAY